MHKLMFFAVVFFVLPLEIFSQEPTREEWISAVESARPKIDLDGFKKQIAEIQSQKEISKRDKEAKIAGIRAEMAAAKRKLWNFRADLPKIHARLLKKGSVGILVTDMLTLSGDGVPAGNSFRVGSAEAADYSTAMDKLTTDVESNKILQVLNKNEFLCEVGDVTVLVSGLDTSDMRDGGSITSLGVVFCIGNATYPTAIGSTKTVPKVVSVSKEVVDRLMKEAKMAIASDRVRTWTDATGKFNIQAELIDYDGKKITLKKSDGSELSLPVARLSKADRKYADDALGSP